MTDENNDTSVVPDDNTYTVDVTYEDGLWVATVEGLPGGATDAETFSQLRDYTRDVISTLIGKDIADADIAWRIPLIEGVDARALVGDRCAVHGYEPVPPDAFRICVECGHVYASEQELLDAHNAVLLQIQTHSRLQWQRGDEPPYVYHAAVSADQVHCCPLCTHDW